MTKAKVYFSDMRTRYGGLSLPQKLGKLIEAAGIGDIDFQNKFAAIKIHFGEPGNLSFLRPNYAKVVVDTVQTYRLAPFIKGNEMPQKEGLLHPLYSNQRKKQAKG